MLQKYLNKKGYDVKIKVAKDVKATDYPTSYSME